MKTVQTSATQARQSVSIPSLPLAASSGVLPAGLIVPQIPLAPEAWDAYVRVSPQDFYDRMTRDLPFRTILSFNINVDGTGYLKFSVKDGTREVADAHRCFSIAAGTAGNHGFVVWEPEDRGPGLGICRCITRNVFGLYQEWGIRTVECDASLEDGAYTWARYGFKIVDGDWPDLQSQLLERLYSLHLPWQDRAAYNKLIGLSDPSALWLVSDLATPVEVDDPVAGVRRTLSVGRALLRGLSWKGVFDFDDLGCMARFDRKVGEVRNG